MRSNSALFFAQTLSFFFCTQKLHFFAKKNIQCAAHTGFFLFFKRKRGTRRQGLGFRAGSRVWGLGFRTDSRLATVKAPGDGGRALHRIKKTGDVETAGQLYAKALEMGDVRALALLGALYQVYMYMHVLVCMCLYALVHTLTCFCV